MTQEVSTSIVIDIPREQAWEKLRDISLPHNYVPGIVKTEIVSDDAEGVGASRYVYRNARSYIQETVEEWNEGQGFLIRLHKGDKPAPPFRSAWFRYQLDDQGNDQTLFTASMGFDLPWDRQHGLRPAMGPGRRVPGKTDGGYRAKNHRRRRLLDEAVLRDRRAHHCCGPQSLQIRLKYVW
jgi:hypothetical protein